MFWKQMQSERLNFFISHTKLISLNGWLHTLWTFKYYSSFFPNSDSNEDKGEMAVYCHFMDKIVQISQGEKWISTKFTEFLLNT